MKEWVIRIYEIMSSKYMSIVLVLILAFIVIDSIYRVYDVWKYEKEQEKKQNENISVSALDNHKDR